MHSIVPVLIQAAPSAPEPTLRGLAAIQAADGLWVALLGMGVVFAALFALFLVMKGLLRLVEPAARVAAPVAAPARVPPAPLPPGPPPQVVAAIVTAIRLEQQRRAGVAQAPVTPAGSGWGAARNLQWAAHQNIFQRSRR